VIEQLFFFDYRNGNALSFESLSKAGL